MGRKRVKKKQKNKKTSKQTKRKRKGLAELLLRQEMEKQSWNVTF